MLKGSSEGKLKWEVLIDELWSTCERYYISRFPLGGGDYVYDAWRADPTVKEVPGFGEGEKVKWLGWEVSAKLAIAKCQKDLDGVPT